MRKAFVVWFLVLGISASLWAQNFLDKKVVKFGETVPDFELEDTTGTKHRLSQYRGQVVMIHFWSATCPFVVRYDGRLKEITNDYRDREVVVLGIDSNSNETVDQIRDVAGSRAVNYPILIDPKNQVADQFGAIATPHVYVVDRQGQLIYEGAVDDQGWSELGQVSQTYARDALEAALAGTPVSHPETNTVGCAVKRAF